MRKLAFGAAFVSLLFVGCDSFPAYDHIAARQIDDQVEVRYGDCGAEAIRSVELRGNFRNDFEDWDVLWRAVADPPVDGAYFVVGITPPRFKEEVAFRGGLPDDAYLSVETTEVDVGIGVGESDLPAEAAQVVTGNSEVMSLDAFKARSREDCLALLERRANPRPLIVRLLPTIVALLALALPFFIFWRRRRQRAS